MKNKDFLTIYEFCERLGIHYNTARSMIKKGRLSALKMGVGGKTSDYRIPVTELQRLAVVNLGEIVDNLVEEKLKNEKRVPREKTV
jgi:excisionase family DNA binding protein